ncbi:MAG: TIGR03790 family protein [Fimbriimonadaceae bacterium]
MLLALALMTVSAQGAGRVLLVENTSSPTSVQLARLYIRRRGIKNVLRISCPDSATDAGKETLPFAVFTKSIENPLRTYLGSHPKIDFIVLTKGIPIRLTGATSGLGGSQPSLDSFIAATGYADRKDSIPIVLKDSGFTGKCWANNFWNSHQRFSHAKFGGYLVTRLDAYTEEEAETLINSAVASEQERPTGSVLIDVAAGHALGDVSKVPRSALIDHKLDVHVIDEMAYGDWDADLVVAAKLLKAKGVPIIFDQTAKFIGHKGELMGYCSWGSNDPSFVADDYESLSFDPGGIAETAVSTSGRTFLPTSGGQSLIADLIRHGATGVKGYCDEPLLQAIASPSILLDRYTSGWTLAESFYAASRFVGWEDIVVGDPLCSPYAKHTGGS